MHGSTSAADVAEGQSSCSSKVLWVIALPPKASRNDACAPEDHKGTEVAIEGIACIPLQGGSTCIFLTQLSLDRRATRAAVGC